MVHRHLFEEIYTWASEYRTVNIYKSEQVLNGLSITYSEKDKIISELKKHHTYKQVEEMTGISKPTLYRALMQLKTNM